MNDPESTPNQRRNPQRGKGNRPDRAERVPVDRNAVPMLRHGTDNNFPAFKKKISVAALEKYHDLGRMFDLGEYFSPEPIDVEFYDLDDDPHGLNLGDLRDARKSRTRKVENMKSDRAGMFAFIMLRLSNESLDAIKLEEGWDEANDEKDPLALWRLIETTHRVGIASRIPAVLKAESRRAYQSCMQSTYESIVKFKERFDDLLANYVEHDNPVMDEDDVAMDFYRALDNSRYASFKTNLVNNINSGAVEQPATLNEMYTQAAAFLVPTRQQHAGTHKTAFATTADRDWRARGGANRGARDNGGQQPNGGRGNGDHEAKKDAPQENVHSNRDCWGCGETGHILRNCPEVGKSEGGDSKSGEVRMTIQQGYPDEDEMVKGLCEDSEHDSGDKVAYLSGSKSTEWYEVLLDNQANTSIIHPRLLSNIRREDCVAKVGGLSGHTVSIDLVGHLVGFFDVLAYHDVAASILCMADVEDMYDITYDAGTSITVHMDERDLVFRRRNKIYVADMRDWETYPKEVRASAMVTTVSQNESKLTKRELKGAQAAMDIIRIAGYPTQKEAIHLVEDGNLLGLKVTAKDMRTAFEIYSDHGVTPAMAKGKGTSRRPPRLETDDGLKSEAVKQQLYSDVMHCEDRKFLISVSEPLHLTLVTPVERETTHCLGTALQEQIDMLREKGFNPVRVHCDPQRALEALAGRFPGTEIDVQGAGDHLSIVDIKIRRVKELMRCVQSDLPWPLPTKLIPELAAYAVSRLNMRRTTSAMNQVAPRVALTGRKIRAARELALAFGDYCEVQDPKVVGVDEKSRRTTIDRTESCIALYPFSNEVGSWKFLNLKTNSTVRRSVWSKMVTTPIVIARMTELAQATPDSSAVTTQADENEPPEPRAEQEVASETSGGEEVTDPMSQDLADTAITEGDESESDDDEGQGVRDETNNDEPTSASTSSDIDEDDTPLANPDEPTIVTEDGEEEAWQMVKGTRRSKRLLAAGKAALAAGVLNEALHATQRPKGSSLPVFDEGDLASIHAFHVSSRKGLQQYGTRAYRAIVKELTQLYTEKKAVCPVHRQDLTSDEAKGIIRSSLFLNPKHNAMGEFEKIKARLVGNGKQQDRDLWPDRSSPTAMLESIMCVLTIAAKEGRKTADLDIGSAYLEAAWKGDPVYIVVEKMLATIYAHEFPELKEFQQEDGTMLMRLDKALYGTLIAGRLWFDKLTTVLTDLGFTPNPLDPCVMNKTISGNQLTVVVFVDDILATSAAEADLTWLMDSLKAEFAEVKGCVRDDFSYLGMHVHNNRGEKQIEVSMEGYEDELMRYSGITGVRTTPASSNLFEPGVTEKLGPSELANFHTLVAKLLYLSCRTRPQIATAVSYLTTRVTCANKGDVKKLNRVLMFINGSRDNKLYLRSDGEGWGVEGFVDVGFGSHDDGKSQTGVIHKLRGSTVSAKSQKQKMVAKDSTEGELVGLTDRVDGVLRLDEFMCLQGHDMDVPIIHQDNQSTISLVTRGGGKYRNVHLRVRQCRLKEMIESGRVRVEYMPTGNMTADILTKPLQGTLFSALESKLLNVKG
jgi:hypothetical protein